MEKTSLAAAISVVNEPKPTMNNTRKDSANEILAEAFFKHAIEPVVTTDKAVVPTISTPVSPSSAEDEQVRIVPISEYKEAALSLAEAFADDDVARYFVDTPDRAHWTREQKWELHVAIMEYMTYAHCLKGLVTAVGPDYGGVALWMPPGDNIDDFFTLLRSGMWRLRYRLSREGKKRFFTEFLPLLHDTKASVLGERDEASWYLVYIGTKPSARGKGYCRKLMEHVTSVADQEGRATYLESSNTRNVKIYRKLGFRENRRMYLQRDEKIVALDVMVREPGAVGE